MSAGRAARSRTHRKHDARTSSTGDRHTASAPEDADADWDAADGVDSWDWDDDVDIVCVGHGRLRTAVALAATRAGLDVLLAEPAAPAAPAESAEAAVPAEPAEPDNPLVAALGSTDEATATYLRALSEDFEPQPAPAVEVRHVEGPLRRELAKSRIATFHGVALRDWGRSCVSSPYGSLYTRATDHQLKASYTSAAGPVEITIVDTVDIDPLHPADSLERWLATLEPDQEPGSFQRLVFDNAGAVVGAVVEWADGPRTVRVRHGVMFALTDDSNPGVAGADLNLCETGEVALVSCPASRFGRLELLVRESR
ncbi:MAG: hypothetical protein WBB07_03055 [Mycobacterium sp.]